MGSGESRRVLAVVGDLFFVAKIREAAKRFRVEVDWAKTMDEALILAERHPDLVILDLNYDAVSPLSLIGVVKKHAVLGQTPILGFVSHVYEDLKAKAREAGCDQVVARSSLIQNLLATLERRSEGGEAPAAP